MFRFLRTSERRDGRAGFLGPRDSTVAVELPNPYGGKPWLSATLAVTRAPQGHGEMLRLRAHVDGCLRMPSQTQAPALADTRSGRQSLSGFGRQLVAGAVRGALARVPGERLAPLARRRWRSWLDVAVSTAPLDHGADALVPERLRGLFGCGPQRSGPGQPRIGLWSGPAGGPKGGLADLVWLQLDSDDLFGAQQSGAAGSRFNLNACLSRLVEPVSGVD